MYMSTNSLDIHSYITLLNMKAYTYVYESLCISLIRFNQLYNLMKFLNNYYIS